MSLLRPSILLLMRRVDGWLSARISRLSNLHERVRRKSLFLIEHGGIFSNQHSRTLKLYEAAETLDFALAAQGGWMIECENLSPQQPPRTYPTYVMAPVLSSHSGRQEMKKLYAGDKSGMEQGSGSKKGSRSKTRGNGASEDQTICKARDDPDAYLKWVHLGLKWVDDVGAFWG
ncbi:hypothetical protein Tco_0409618 [Tanacetum coccineum]